MRIRRFYHQRRIMCLILIFVWSFSTMVLFWRKIKQKDRYKNIRDAIQILSNEFEISGSKKTELEETRDFLGFDEFLDLSPAEEYDYYSGEYINMAAALALKHMDPTIKIRHIVKSKVDYGRDRDLDVEGVNDYLLWYENFQDNQPQLPTLARQQKCTKPVHNIAFVKTHHTGSDVLTNILNRYGDLNNLNVALPTDGLPTFYWPMRFQWKYIDITMLNGSLPNIISNHARYNNDVMDNILNPGSVYITILRDPVTQLETTFNNMGFGGLLQVVNTTDQLLAFLENPKFYIQGVIRRKRFKDTLNLIKNAQFFDLGLSTTEYHRKNVIKMTTQELYEKFSVVLIYEYLDESLLLMKRRLCWQLDDILYLKFHYTNHDQWNRDEISDVLAEKIRKWNEADLLLYEFFNKTLWKEIKYEGEGFWKELKEFKTNQRAMENDCVKSESIQSDEKFSLSEIPTARRNVDEASTAKRGSNEKKGNMISLDNNSSKKIVDNNNKTKSSNRLLRDLLVSSKVFKKKSIDTVSISKGAKEKIDTHSKSHLKNVGEGEESYINDENDNLVSRNSKKDQIPGDIVRTNKNNEGNLYTENNILIGSGTEKPISKEITNIERMLSRTATSWNKYMCKKLLMTELEYLDYFRRKHTYGKAAQRK